MLFEFRPPTTTTASTWSISRSRARWCSFVGRQTVSMNRISAVGFRASDQRAEPVDVAVGAGRLADHAELRWV